MRSRLMPAKGASGSRIFGLRPRPGRHPEREARPRTAPRGRLGRVRAFLPSAVTPAKRSARRGPLAARAAARRRWPSLSCAYTPVASRAPPPPASSCAPPSLSSSRTARSAEPGSASRGPVDGTPEHHHDRRGSPIPGLAMLARNDAWGEVGENTCQGCLWFPARHPRTPGMTPMGATNPPYARLRARAADCASGAKRWAKSSACHSDSEPATWIAAVGRPSGPVMATPMAISPGTTSSSAIA